MNQRYAHRICRAVLGLSPRGASTIEYLFLAGSACFACIVVLSTFTTNIVIAFGEASHTLGGGTRGISRPELTGKPDPDEPQNKNHEFNSDGFGESPEFNDR